MRQVDQGLLLKTRVVTEAETESEGIQVLNELMPDGLQEPDTGKLVGVELVTHDVFLMAYDYDNSTWFSIGSLQGSTLDAMIDDPQVVDPSKASQTTV